LPMFTAPRLSLRQLLTIPFVLLIALLAVLISTISFTAGQSAVNSLSERYLLDVSERIAHAVDEPLGHARLVLDAAAPEAVITSQALSSLDDKSLITRMWVATGLGKPKDGNVYFGDEQSRFVGIRRSPGNQPELRQKPSPSEPRASYTLSSIDQTPVFRSIEKAPYDARTRPWYKLAVASKSYSWSEVYPSFSTNALLVTLAKPVYDGAGALQGIYATDISLQALSEFLRSLTISANGVAYIVEADGNLIAQSTLDAPFSQKDGKPVRLNAANSKNELIRSTYAAFAKELTANAPRLQSRTISTPSGTVYAALQTLSDPAGLKWHAITAVPEADLIGNIRQGVIKSMVLSAVAVLLALLLGVGIMNWVTRDLGTLTQAVRRVRDGQPYRKLEMKRQDEIGELAHNFEEMQSSLRTDRLTGLCNREAFYKELNFRLNGAKAQGLSPHLAVLFCDLVKFKMINDTLGHQVGDAVLIEYGQRLQAAVRAGDVVARYAGDEFVVLLNGVETLEQATIAVEKIHAQMQPVFASLKGSGVNEERMQGSVGIAIYPADGDDAETLIKAADQQMYKVKFAANDGKASR
jgi:diguanylate cyclase (GGDEF)-like protein